ncbi:adenylate/guanylate cyclase domain-containing protein [Jiangella rhizosphaerae]|uniref:Adenylate/guanylate cyclase domain-containing protein n=1 Tax=Jiangella rhizosphaerae TaxID=2293569 RepID=A0A418KVX4_9ACTN|nr:adenylate/guanylate cyclase domain-containing protein [Jiangella rhizosphaerae]RIQ34772.1 adenylate/guanylate cyclase domain-containing protein [Jiangella rhizosphaerae]
MTGTPADPPARAVAPRLGLAALLLALPIAGLVVLLAVPEWDGTWQHHPAHFWLVLGAAALSTGLAYATGTAARRRNDARVFLVSLAFLAAAGFLGLHALATPGVLLDAPNAGFALATPVGLLVAAVFAAASATELGGGRAHAVMRRAGLIRGALLAVLVLWGAASVGGLAPLDDPAPPERASGPLVWLAVAALLLYVFAVVRYLRLPSHPGSVTLLLAMAAAFVLLAEASVAVAFGRNWHASWWEWHLLMLAAFALVALSAHRQWYEERFAGLYLGDTAKGTRELSVLFADLQGFTSFSERTRPQDVTEMLNAYFTIAIPPVVERFGGTVDRLVGDALMVTFNRDGDQPDHARRAAAAALAIQQVTATVAAAHPGWPRFRVGVNTGEVAVGLLGTAGGRTFTVIGDTVNLAARLESAAPVGGVLIGAETARQLSGARTERVEGLEVKGKTGVVEAYRLLGL